MIIRFEYCPPNPGPNKKLRNKWFTNIQDAINNWKGETIWISYGRKYEQITFEKLLEL